MLQELSSVTMAWYFVMYFDFCSVASFTRAISRADDFVADVTPEIYDKT